MKSPFRIYFLIVGLWVLLQGIIFSYLLHWAIAAFMLEAAFNDFDYVKDWNFILLIVSFISAILGVWFIRTLITQKNLLPITVTFFVSWAMLAAIELASIPTSDQSTELTPGGLMGLMLIIAGIIGGPMIIKLLGTKIKK